MNVFRWLKDQFSMDHIYQCTHCGKEDVKVTEVSWYYSLYAPSINYPLKRGSIHANWLCKECMKMCFDNYFDPTGIFRELESELKKRQPKETPHATPTPA